MPRRPHMRPTARAPAPARAGLISARTDSVEQMMEDFDRSCRIYSPMHPSQEDILEEHLMRHYADRNHRDLTEQRRKNTLSVLVDSTSSYSLETKVNQGVEVLRMLQKPENHKKFSPKELNFFASKEWNKILVQILPSVTTLTLCADLWNNNDYFLQALEHDTSIQELTLYLPDRGTGKIRDLCQVLHKNTTLQNLTVMSKQSESYLTQRSQLVCLIKGLGASTLSTLAHLKFTGKDFDYTSIRNEEGRNATLKVSASEMCFSDPTYSMLLLKLLQAASLHPLSLTLESKYNLSATFTIPPFLEARLVSLKVENVQVDLPSIIQLLRTNPNLQSLQLLYPVSAPATLLSHPTNQTLQELVPDIRQILQEGLSTNLGVLSPFDQMCPQIGYLVDLNRLGLVQVRNGDVTDLIWWLVKAQSDDRVQSRGENVQSCSLQSVLFGLMKERPELWSQQLDDSNEVTTIVLVAS